MPQVHVRDCRADDRAWIQSVYREYLMDLAPAATGLFPLLAETGQREPEQWARFFADSRAHALTICYAEQPVGFAKIVPGTVRPQPVGRARPVPTAPASPAGGASKVAREGGGENAAVEFSMAEFFIARPWRRRGVGGEAVRLILDRFQGHWLITEHQGNDAAVHFWRKVVRAYTAGKYQERIVNGEVQQRFESGQRRPRPGP